MDPTFKGRDGKEGGKEKRRKVEGERRREASKIQIELRCEECKVSYHQLS